MKTYRPLILAATAIAIIAGVQGSTLQKTAAKGNGIVCKLEAVFDPTTQKNAFTFFVPRGWTPHSSLSWDTKPATYHVMITASTPDQKYEVTQLGKEVYSYNIFYNVNGGPPTVNRSPVHHATDYLHTILDHIVETEGLTGVEVVDEVNAPLPTDHVPEMFRNASNGPMGARTPVFETGYLQVKFSHAGLPMTAMMGTTLRGANTTKVIPGRNFLSSEGGVFTAGPTTFLIMPTDAPMQRQREMQIIAGSIQMTPQFDNYMRALVDRLARIQIGANQAGQQYANATFHERAMSQFNQQMHMKDAYSHAFCNYVSDLQDYKDQKGHIVTAPASYKYAWSDGSGNYLLNDDPRVDLRGVGDGNWKLMEKARIGEQ